MPPEPKASGQETGASQHTGSEDAPKQAAPCSEKSDPKISRDGAECALSQLDGVVDLACNPGFHFDLADFERSLQLRFHDPCDHAAEFLPRFLCIALNLSSSDSE
jgi:hypothetical protein